MLILQCEKKLNPYGEMTVSPGVNDAHQAWLVSELAGVGRGTVTMEIIPR